MSFHCSSSSSPYAALYEDALLKHRRESEEASSTSSTIEAQIYRRSVLQAAGWDSLLHHVTTEMDQEQTEALSSSSWSLEKSLTLQLQIPMNEPLTADSFFATHPECARMSQREEDLLSDEEDLEIEEEEPAAVVEIIKTVAPPVIDVENQQPLPPSSNRFHEAASQQYRYANPPPQQQHQQQSKPSFNPYNNNNRPSNPYHQKHHSRPSSKPSSSFYDVQHNSWDNVEQSNRGMPTTTTTNNNAGGIMMNNNNPFQSARQYQHQNPQDEGGGGNDYYNTTTAPPSPPRGPKIPESLKRKFQPPIKRDANNNNKNQDTSSSSFKRNGGTKSKPPINHSTNKPQQQQQNNNNDDDDDDELPEELKGLDKELVEKIQNEIMESGEKVTFDDIAGLEGAKETVQELVIWPMKRPDLFTGLRQGPNGLLLYGPPGTGKTLIGKAISHESGATFFAISSSSLTSKWIGEGEKLVRTLFAVAAYREPAVVFIDEIDSLLTQRKADENEASRRIKTEFLVQLDGTSGRQEGQRVLVIGATNRPHELDDAARRRFVKRLYIPLPALEDRKALLMTLLGSTSSRSNRHTLTDADYDKLAHDTDGFSGADLKALCVEAAMGPLRGLGARALHVDAMDVPPIGFKHFRKALKGVNPSVSPSDLDVYIEWDKTYGSRRASAKDDDDSDGE